MTTKWADGFEDSTAAGLTADYNVAGTAVIGTGRRAGSSSFRHTGTTSLTRNIGGSAATMFTSLAIKPILAGLTDRTNIRFLEGSIIHVGLAITSAGAIQVWRGDLALGTLIGSVSAVFSGDVWSWIQVKVVIHDTTGSVEIRDASGAVLLSLTNIDTRSAGTGVCDAVSIGIVGNNSGVACDYDDWHVWDSTGTICNTFTNDTRVDHKLPDGAGNYAQFTPSAGANYTCVDEANHNTTDYVDSATAGHKDSYTFGDLAHSPPSIFAVLRTAVAQKDDAGARSLKLLTRRAAVDYVGSAITLNQGSYMRIADVQEADPSTAVAWTQAGFNAAEFGVENV
jgi:hypothetical protein